MSPIPHTVHDDSVDAQLTLARHVLDRTPSAVETLHAWTTRLLTSLAQRLLLVYRYRV